MKWRRQNVLPQLRGVKSKRERLWLLQVGLSGCTAFRTPPGIVWSLWGCLIWPNWLPHYSKRHSNIRSNTALLPPLGLSRYTIVLFSLLWASHYGWLERKTARRWSVWRSVFSTRLHTDDIIVGMQMTIDSWRVSENEILKAKGLTKTRPPKN
jgi:hypothetical protein